MNKYLEEREEINRLFNAPEYRRIKYLAFSVISIGILLLLAMIIWLDDLSPKAVLLMRGCAGLCALIFVIIVGVMTYKVNQRHINNRQNNRHH